MPARSEALLILLLTCSASIKAGELIESVYKESLTTPGYYLVTTIPEGATSINFTELTHTKNFLAIRLQNGNYLFNGDYNIVWSGKYEGAGTVFIYIRRSKNYLESFYSPGPLESSIDVMLGYQEKVPEVFYQYELPIDFPTIEYNTTISPLNGIVVTEAGDAEVLSSTQLISTDSSNVMLADEIRTFTPQVPRKKRKRKVVWSSVGFSRCNKSCAGGFQTKRFICVNRRNRMHVDDSKCRRLPKPKEVVVSCNSTPCSPEWQNGQWSQCSVTCGIGIRTRELQCIQEISDKLHILVNPENCPKDKPAPLQESCKMPDCNIYSTTIPMKASDRTKFRDPMDPDKTKLTGYSNMLRPTFGNSRRSQFKNSTGTFDSNVSSTAPYDVVVPNVTTRPAVPAEKKKSTPRWKVEEWSACSATCGLGTRTRVVTCVTYGKPCNFSQKPRTKEFCNMGNCTTDSDKENEIPEALEDSPWLYSAWPEQCSAECGPGIVTRRFYCENFMKNSTCNEKKIPPVNRTCVSAQCAQWFVGPWSRCSSSCDIGIETRDVVCVSRYLGVLKLLGRNECIASEKPITIQSCVGPPCKSSWFMSDWSQCSQSCGGGIQVRDVKCIGPDGMPISAREMECDEEKKPVSKRKCNEVPCDFKNSKDNVNISESSFRGTYDAENECQDILPNCRIIRQRGKESKNKCQIEEFRKGCCKACRYASYINRDLSK